MGTERTDQSEASAPAVQGYRREVVEDFLSAVEVERRRLHEIIRESEARTQRARAAIDVYRVIMDMLLAVQAEIAEIRRAAEEEAAAILRRGDEEAEALFRAAYAVEDGMIHLVRAEAAEDPLRHTTPEPAVREFGSGFAVDVSGSNDYMAYLRGALSDQAPLGPRLD
jgi:cell division septum initiation protein DivIVA